MNKAWQDIKARWGRWRRVRTLRRIERLHRQASPLGVVRQFLYLDSVSLRSLYVGRFGAEDARVTLTSARGRERERTGTLGFPQIAGLELSSSARSKVTSSSSIQVEQVASEQALFRDFLIREERAGSASAVWDGTPEAFGGLPRTAPAISRGDLIQVRVRLATHATFRLATFADAIKNLSADAPTLAARLDGTQEIGAFLRHMLIEQVPLEAVLVDWGLDKTTRTLVAASDQTLPVKLGALTDASRYWIDLRRVLFDDAECIAMVRVTSTGPVDTWSPVKLFDAVADLPAFEPHLRSFETQFVSAIEGIGREEAAESAYVAVLATYARACAGPARLSAEAESAVRLTAQAHLRGTHTEEKLDIAARAVEAALTQLGVVLPDPDERARAMEFARVERQASPPEVREFATTAKDCAFILGEVIALYW